MSNSKKLHQRSDSKCELCGNGDELQVYLVPPKATEEVDNAALLCATCQGQIEDKSIMEINHWHCLRESMWSEFASIQVLSWRMLNRLRAETWAQDLLEMLYLDEDTLEWAKTGEESGAEEEDKVIHLDSNGNVLETGDTVVLTQNLNVKGANFTAKRGTAVRRIHLVENNAEHIEGRVNGQRIVILTKYVKKQIKA